MEAVDCQECGQRYDSQENAFCPRCGSEGKAPASAPTRKAADKHDPARKRAQIGGVVLLAMGVISAILYGTVAVAAGTLVPEFSEELLGDQPGGTLSLQVLNNGTAANLTIEVHSLAGTLLFNGTTGTEPLSIDIPEHAAVNITVYGAETFHRKALALQGSTTKVVLDVATDSPADSHWIGLDALVKAMRGLLAFFIAMSLFVAFAGFAALKLRWRPVAIGGGVVGLIPSLIMAVAIPNVGSLLILALMAAALAFIAMGRQHFA